MIPKECESINVKIQELNAQKKELQADLPGLAGAQKWALLQQISALQHKITTLKNELNSCILRGGGKLPLKATFNAAFTLRTSYP
ncbi:hypothetical protein [Paenibacillus mucilaginosus]|uniref:hypothetical protein n=1 Tax=Paenibacillus mucilaginosus TaxID=61624 RepID=UPI0005A261D7|nr:hypothetical protein [Paenibacillus mucilaginosus]MCG7216150.1 hypothetical protein [Paenibacillus mucilaginosus]WDM28054.1 hypothetical protein KCX80_01870 [Paenibacillus mucilaginosus]WFA16228.1 hypothetical protein ERY13_01855 [Paenibacillus mucilaginosus]